MSNENAPQSAADPRPNNEPYYIDTHCPDCNTALVLSDKHKPSGETDALVHPDVWEDRGDTIWHDEWVCPNCENGIHLDWPEEGDEGGQETSESVSPEEALEMLPDAFIFDTDDLENNTLEEAKDTELSTPDQDFEW